MKLKSLNKFMEQFWLMVAIITSIYGIYMVYMLGLVEAKWYVFFPIIAILFYYTRRRLRLALEKKESENL
jgi:membrane protein implicated in regulation of membrane protease activity